MNRKTTVALVLFVVLGVAAYLALSKPPKGQRTAERDRPLPELAADQIARVTISEKDRPKVTLVRKAGSWNVVAPLEYPADEHATRTLVDRLGGLAFGDLVTERKDRHRLHKVDDDSGVAVLVEDGAGKRLVELVVGESQAGFTMLRPAGKDAVYQAVGSLRPVFSKDLKSWRDRTISRFKADEVLKLKATTGAGEIVLARKDAKAAWEVQQSTTPVDQLDSDAPRSLLSTLASLSAFDFADEARPDKTGLDRPQATLVATLADGKQHKLLVGNKDNDNYFVSRGDGDQVFLIKQYSADNLIKRPVDFRDKSILSFKADDLVELRLTRVEDNGKKRTTAVFTRKEADWLKDGKKVADDTKVKQAVDALASLKADRFASHTADELGMSRPEWIVQLALRDRTRHQLTVGSNNKDGFFGVQRKGVADLFACRQYQLDRFLLKDVK